MNETMQSSWNQLVRGANMYNSGELKEKLEIELAS